MQDQPTAIELLDVAAHFVRNEFLPRLTGHAAFNARVTANVLDIVRRELMFAPAANASEIARLQALLGETGDLETLNHRLCERLASGEIGLDTPGLADHLWQTTLAKLSIDQPGYASYRAIVGEAAPKA